MLLTPMNVESIWLSSTFDSSRQVPLYTSSRCRVVSDRAASVTPTIDGRSRAARQPRVAAMTYGRARRISSMSRYEASGDSEWQRACESDEGSRRTRAASSHADASGARAAAGAAGPRPERMHRPTAVLHPNGPQR
eukprot:366382-Chlamydomonas_euryale.AAC.4